MGFFNKRKNKGCEHKWAGKGQTIIVLDNKYPRVVKVCSKCGVMAHFQILSSKQLRELEEDRGRE